ncbi:MAG: hypothetical protein GY832_38625, partial [Chloroflexi bacterium]|nr:hypothetical protein [Chloroflexota bacterium]
MWASIDGWTLGCGELAVRGVVCDHKRGGADADELALLWGLGGLLVVTLAPAPLLTTAETEGRSLGLPRFLPVREPGNEPCVTDCREIYRPDLLIGPAADSAPVRSLA